MPMDAADTSARALGIYELASKLARLVIQQGTPEEAGPARLSSNRLTQTTRLKLK